MKVLTCSCCGSLKKHLEPYAFQEYDSDDNTDEKHKMFYIDDVLKAIKAWLEEKRKTIPAGWFTNREIYVSDETLCLLLRELGDKRETQV